LEKKKEKVESGKYKGKSKNGKRSNGKGNLPFTTQSEAKSLSPAGSI